MRSRLLCLTILLLVASGCQQDDSQSGAASSSENAGGGAKKYRIAVIPKGTTHEFWKSVHAGAANAAKELGDVEILWKGSLLESDRETQISVMQTFIADHVDGICLAPNDSQALVEYVEQAAQARKVEGAGGRFAILQALDPVGDLAAAGGGDFMPVRALVAATRLVQHRLRGPAPQDGERHGSRKAA